MLHDWVQGWGFNNRPVMPYAASWQSSDRDGGPCQCPAVAGTARVEVETVQDDQQDGGDFPCKWSLFPYSAKHYFNLQSKPGGVQNRVRIESDGVDAGLNQELCHFGMI